MMCIQVNHRIRKAVLGGLVLMVGVFILHGTEAQEQAATKIQEVLSNMAAQWDRCLPIQVRYRVVTRFNKKVRARQEEALRLTNPSETMSLGALEQEVVAEWVYDGKRMLARRRFTSPDVLAKRPGMADGWHSIYLWDGKQYITLEVQDNREVPVIASIVPPDSEHASTPRSLVAKHGADLLLCAPDGRGWSEFLKERPVQLANGELRGLSCLLLSWEEQWGEKIIRTIYVVPSFSFAVVRQEDKRANGELVHETEVRTFEQVKGLWLPKAGQEIMYVSARDYGEHLPMATLMWTAEQISAAVSLAEDTFAFTPERLPKGSEVLDIGRGSANYVGSEVNDTDIIRLAEAIKRYLKGNVSLAEVEKVLPRQKKVAFPFMCGPHSMLAVCHILGVSTTSQELAQLAGTDDKGLTTMAGMVKALKAKGLDARAFEMQLQDLRAAPLPAILHIEPQHFSVLLKFEGQNAVFLDPPCRIVIMSTEDLLRVWSKRCITIRK